VKRPPAGCLQHLCQSCGALPGNDCITRYGSPSRYPHSVRGAPNLPESGMPDLRAWWRSVRAYEGVNRKPRPSWLVVP
jgi:hypothetical protein